MSEHDLDLELNWIDLFAEFREVREAVEEGDSFVFGPRTQEFLRGLAANFTERAGVAGMRCAEEVERAIFEAALVASTVSAKLVAAPE